MAIRLTTTAQSSARCKCLVIGPSGIGKTRLCATAPKPLIISAEKGMLSLKDENLPVIEISNHIDLEDAYKFVTTDPRAKRFETICIDSVSDIAESCLAWFKENPVDGNTHPQAAYGHMADKILPMLKKFRDLNDFHVYFTAKIKRQEDAYTGIDTFMASCPGRVLGPALPYLFDFVFQMRIGETESGKKYRYLQTQPDLQYHAKDRSGKLNFIEEPNLAKIFAKALGQVSVKGAPAKAEKSPKKVEETEAETSEESPEKGESKKPLEAAKAPEAPEEKATDDHYPGDGPAETTVESSSTKDGGFDLPEDDEIPFAE